MLENHLTIDRRQFLKGVGLTTASLALPGALSALAAETTTGVPRRKFGKTGETVSIIGVGGHTLATAKDEAESIRIVHEAIDQGVNFMDNAWEYHDGRSEVVMGKALAGGWREKAFLMTKVCTHGKGKDFAMNMLEESLKRLQTDHLDLWMIHQLDTQEQVTSAFAPGGAVEALDAARKQGKIRFGGFTGHADPEVHLAMLAHDYAWDAVLMPINSFEANRTGFRTRVLPVVAQRGIAGLGIKSLGGNGKVVKDGKFTAEQCLRFSLSQPLTVQIVGVNSVDQLRTAVDIARKFKPMTPAEMEKLTAHTATLDNPARYCCYRQPGYGYGHVGRA